MVLYKMNLYENLTSSKILFKRDKSKYKVKNLRKEELNITKI